ncbi:MAG TPA: Asp-tRNA(Asn)/Glu-tRNA(Gln) amidotransferase subunit GatA [bacterium]|nr:Asp-tRNA(Asn)/Glu-tRNA(Gln) amidotransferase subunit GatA [bacterium]HPN43631.1 Asp-tRNA(Asn)/Glu-tRNA(Gln) amidotransferase subunit GatA [bacterium]
MNISSLDYSSLRSLLIAKEISCQEVTRFYLDKIEQNRQLNAFISVFADKALERAREIDYKLAQGTAGSLAGLVLGIKDLLVMQNARTTCGSKILENFIPPFQATVLNKLQAEDAIFIGKTNLDEFGMGSSNENSYYKPVKNPHDTTRVPGGSSGGSAAAVAGSLCTAALGTDTGGSIRQPASFCGVVGLKPTYGRVSRFGMVAYASSLDQIGPLAKSVADAALLLRFMAGFDELDSTSASVPVADYSVMNGSVKGLRVGIPKEYFISGLEPDVNSAIENTIQLLKDSGAEICEVSLPHTEYAIATYYIIATAEASANLARFDGVRYGYRDEHASNLEEMYINSRTNGFGEEVKRRIMLGTYVLSSGYYDAYYRKAQKVRTLIKKDFEEAFKTVHCILTPTSPTTAFRLNEKVADPLTMYLSDVFTVSLNLAGLPGISLPCGKDKQGLPIGVQLIGKAFDEQMILRFAGFIEKNNPILNNRQVSV